MTLHTPLDRLCVLARRHHPAAVVALRTEAVTVRVGREVVAQGESVEACIAAMLVVLGEG